MTACSEGSTTTAKPVTAENTKSVGTTPRPDIVGRDDHTHPIRTPSAQDEVAPRPVERLTDASRLRLDGIGPITVGMTLEQASAATGMNVRITSKDTDNPCRYAEAEDGPAGLSFMVIGSEIVRVDVRGDRGPSPIATLSGISVGSTEAEVLATYPGRIDVRPNPYSETYHDLIPGQNRCLSGELVKRSCCTELIRHQDGSRPVALAHRSTSGPTPDRPFRSVVSG